MPPARDAEHSQNHALPLWWVAMASLCLLLSACSSEEPLVVSQGTPDNSTAVAEFRDPDIDPINRGELPLMTDAEIETMQDLRNSLEGRFHQSTNGAYQLTDPEVRVDSSPVPWHLQLDWLDEVVYIDINDPGAEQMINTSEFRGYEVSRMRVGSMPCGTGGEFVIDEQGWIDFYAYVNTGTGVSLLVGCENRATDFPETSRLLVQYTTSRFKINQLDDDRLQVEFANGETHTYQECTEDKCQ